jgi:glycosyltransferase involved in cell wall biosynthesis
MTGETETQSLPKLVIATDNYLPRHDGVSRFLQEIIPRLTQKFSVTLICPRFEYIPPLANVHMVTVPLSRFRVGDFQAAQCRPLLLHKALSGADLVFTQTLGPIGATTILVARKKLLTTASYIHSLDWELIMQATAPAIFKRHLPWIGRLVARFLYRRTQRLFVPSDGISEQFTWEHIHASRRIVRLGVDAKQFVPMKKTDREQLRERLGFTPEDIVIGYHGRIAREKDLSTLLRAFIKLRSRHASLKLFLIGNGMRHLEKKFSKQPGVTLYPAVPDVENYLPAMDMYALPSLTETTSLSVLEAMSCELPVVATPVGFVKDYIVPGKTGLLTKKRDSYHLAKQLQRYIQDEEFRRTIGRNARVMVVKDFNWDETAKTLISEMEALL